MNQYDVNEELKPISAWGYIGYQILFSLPIIGIILILVFSFGGIKNENVRNFARFYVLSFVIAIILIIVLFALGIFSYFAQWAA